MHREPGAPTPARLRLSSLREDVGVETDPADERALVVCTRWGEIRLPDVPPAIRDSLRRMSFGPVSLPNVAGLREADVARLLHQLRGCVVHSLGVDGEAEPLLSAEPLTQQAVFDPVPVPADRPVRLSRFAAMRAADGGMLLESPLAHHKVVLHRPLAAWVAGSMGRATTVAGLARTTGIAEPLVADVVAHLVAAGMVALGEVAGPGVRFAEDEDPALIPWSHHDLLFHSRSRQGRHDGPLGAVFGFVDRLPSLPAVKPVPDGPRIALHRPDPAELAAADPPLTEVVEGRRSHREFADGELTVRHLGELLFRTARVRALHDTTGAGGAEYTVSDRPYPSSGALYELELYLTVDRCAGVPAGIYHYDPLGHALTLVNDSAAQRGELLDGAMVLTGTTRRPPALITMTARMARLSWMYSGISYSTALKHVGVLQQTLYLAATAMGLAPCALVVGDSEVATEAFHLDWPAEVSVGEFVIGARPRR